ncbi:hypothetical protein ACTXT7_013719 [Hymenolepis weldensis]
MVSAQPGTPASSYVTMMNLNKGMKSMRSVSILLLSEPLSPLSPHVLCVRVVVTSSVPDTPQDLVSNRRIDSLCEDPAWD